MEGRFILNGGGKKQQLVLCQQKYGLLNTFSA
jgi:hypothetical protein